MFRRALVFPIFRRRAPAPRSRVREIPKLIVLSREWDRVLASCGARRRWFENTLEAHGREEVALFARRYLPAHQALPPLRCSSLFILTLLRFDLHSVCSLVARLVTGLTRDI